MAEQVGHLLEAGAVAVQAGRRGVTRDMGPRPVGTPLDPGEGATDHVPDERRPDGRAYRHGMADEDVPAGSHGPAAPGGRRDRIADPRGGGELPPPAPPPPPPAGGGPRP